MCLCVCVFFVHFWSPGIFNYSISVTFSAHILDSAWRYVIIFPNVSKSYSYISCILQFLKRHKLSKWPYAELKLLITHTIHPCAFYSFCMNWFRWHCWIQFNNVNNGNCPVHTQNKIDCSHVNLKVNSARPVK